MNRLLPRSSDEFQLTEYWDGFFTKRSSPFEWYGEYVDLCVVLNKYLKPKNQVLVVGCGNSLLSEGLYDSGFHCIENIDVSGVVIKQMSARNVLARPLMKFTRMDVLSMDYGSGRFDCVIDKGTLDAIYSTADDATAKKVNMMFSEIKRVLKIAGRYLCVTLAQDHVLHSLLTWFNVNWMVRIHKVDLCRESAGIGGSLPVFVFVITKMTVVEGRVIKVFEFVNDEGKCVRCSDTDGLITFVKDSQQYSIVKHHLSKLRVGMAPVQLDMWSPDNTEEPRYTLSVVDQHRKGGKNGPFAIFIVPQGRETDWLYASDVGQAQLAKSAGFERLVIVSMHRGHTYSGLEAVKDEVGGRAIELLPSGLPSHKKYPVLTTDDGIGSAKILHRGQSEHSGPYIVEETEGIRKLVFQRQANSSQTTKVMRPSYARGGTSLIPDHSVLSDDYHQAIIATLALLPWKLSSKASVKVLMVGLGGGSLAMFIHECLQMCYLDVVELDPSIVQVAEEWFGFVKPDPKLKVYVQDGIAYVNSLCADGKEGCYDVIIFDVDAKDSCSGISSPPMTFVDVQFLESVKSLLNDRGLFICNVVARNQQCHLKVLSNISDVFPGHYIVTLPEDVNELVVCLSLHSTREAKTACAQTKKKNISLSDMLSSELVESNITYLAIEVQNATAGCLKCEFLKRVWMQLLHGTSTTTD